MNKETKDNLEYLAAQEDYSLQGVTAVSIAISLKRIADRLDWDAELRIKERLDR